VLILLSLQFNLIYIFEEKKLISYGRQYNYTPHNMNRASGTGHLNLVDIYVKSVGGILTLSTLNI